MLAPNRVRTTPTCSDDHPRLSKQTPLFFRLIPRLGVDVFKGGETSGETREESFFATSSDRHEHSSDLVNG
eukprot:4844979-Ditylum_brightwellii.AAC.2